MSGWSASEKPYRRSQNASEGPAMLAPEMRMSLFFRVAPSRVVEARPAETAPHPWRSTSSRSSVMSSMAYLTPSRPSPEPFTPP